MSSLAASDVETVLKSVGIEPEKERIDTLIKNLEGKTLHELIAAGSTKLSTLSGKFEFPKLFAFPKLDE